MLMLSLLMIDVAVIMNTTIFAVAQRATGHDLRIRRAAISASPVSFHRFVCLVFLLHDLKVPRISLQIRSDDFDELLGGFGLWRCRFIVGINDMKPNMPLDHFAHQAVDGTATGRQRL
jgi:hypothetical protein